jgi:hypothetical protein
MSDYPPQGDQYEFDTFVRRLSSIADPVMRRRQLQRHVLSVDAETFARHLHEVLVRGIRGDELCAELMHSVLEYIDLADGRDLLALEAVNLAARREGLLGLGWMLLRPDPMLSVERLILRQRGRAMSLGERKSVATGFDRTALERIVHDTDPAVIERLCRNPRVLEQHILTVVTRRPTMPEILRVVAREPRWSRRATIREAIAQNPYTDTGMAIRMLPGLPIPALERLRYASELHPAVRDFAAWLLALRVGQEEGMQIPSYEVIAPSFQAPIEETSWKSDEAVEEGDVWEDEVDEDDTWDPDE